VILTSDAGTIKGVKVFLNGERITRIKNFKGYCEMYVKALREESGGEEKVEIIYATVGNRWEIAFAVSNGNFQQVSFVNSIATTSGGTHVNHIADQLCTKLESFIKKKNKTGAAVKNAQIRNHFFLFVNCLIENPAFTSQTKEQLTTKQSAFGSKCPLPDDFVKKVSKTEVITNIVEFANIKADKAAKRADGGRRTRCESMNGVMIYCADDISRIHNPNLTDANMAGTAKHGHECVLILTEGLSASGLARAGIAAISGHDRYGVFPLRGKVLNVRDASHDQIMKNVEIQQMKQILGLQHKKHYDSAKELRYGHIMIMTDQDHDGSHIKGLLINFFEAQFPSLLRLPNFLIEFITPIVKVFKGNLKKPTKEISFFTMPEYEYWKEHNTESGWKHKYYKGLGTSGDEDAKVYFADLDRHMKYFHPMENEGQRLIELAFAKSKADERKEWLRTYQPGTYLDHSTDRISYPDFVNKELILFSIADCARSIPSVVDGLKPGQRKIIFAAFKRNLKNEIKVVQLAGYVSEHTGYQHGEVSLQSTITAMAQMFTGSNNVNLLDPSGNFGSRLQGGKDAASARYIYTSLSAFSRKVLPPHDERLLTYNLDDGVKIEPEWYVPVVPMLLVNGAEGIGTGKSLPPLDSRPFSLHFDRME
jgi:DNA topoisomerase-2